MVLKLISCRILRESDKDLEKISSEFGINKTDLVRYCLNRTLKELKTSAIKAGGFENLKLFLEEFRR